MRIAILTLMTVALPFHASAADPGTYRPGLSYHSVIANGPDVCDSQCAGDARCRGWNYVKPAPDAAGVCEFQAEIGPPVSSAISISGISRTHAPLSPRIVPGATHTVRVGTPPPAQVAIATADGAPPSAGRPETQRRVVREPLSRSATTPHAGTPSRPGTLAASHTRPSGNLSGPVQRSRPSSAQPRFRPMLDAATPMPANPLRSPPPAGLVRSQAALGAPQVMGARASPHGSPRPPLNQPIANRTVAPTTQMSPPTLQQPPIPQRPAGVAMPRASAANPIGFDTPRQGLFGRLHDDVQVPASNGPVPNDPNMSVPTATARPVVPVGQTPLSPLAGPVRR